MPFNTALSGIRAASSELSVTGNNIANASTTGFKSARTEFGDVYATSVLGAGSNQAGAGVQVLDISQSFTQGNITFTENQLDLAINGNGFFVVSQEGESLYTRAGAFGLDDGGFITSNSGARLQGFSADGNGNISGIQGDLQIQTSNLSPRQTTGVENVFNLDSTEPVVQSTGRRFTADGNVIGLANTGLQTATTSTMEGSSFTVSPGSPLSVGAGVSFDLELNGSSVGNNGTVSINLSTATGVPDPITNLGQLQTLASVINGQIFSPTAPATPIDVAAQVTDLGGDNYRLDFIALQEGDPSSIVLTPTANANLVGLDTTSFTAGIASSSNGYPAQSLDITDPDGNTITYTSSEGSTAARIASELNSIQGLSATAVTTASISNYNNANGNMSITINNVALSSSTLAELSTAINSLTNSTLPGITASLDTATNSVTLSSAVGDDLRISMTSTDDQDRITVQGDPATPAETLEFDEGLPGNIGLSDPTFSDASTNSVVVGGAMEITIDDGYAIGNEVPLSVGLFQPIGDSTASNNPIFTNVIINAFDPNDQSTYNSATSMSIYDSLGNSHVLTQYFVKQEYDPADPTTSANHWLMYAQIDGQDVGDPDVTDPLVPTQASYNVFFNEDGSLNNLLTDDILVSNWSPTDEEGNPNGALPPRNVLNGGSTVIPDPPTSSNFVITLEGTTQFGSDFSVNDVDQNGYTTGRLSGLNVDDSGVIFARFTNGESLILGQVVMADFSNQEGLQPVGNSMWAENFESGGPNIGVAGTASLGAIQAGSLEESNVDLSEQLVALIIAQRNFQASAKTIETADQTTQTIINLR